MTYTSHNEKQINDKIEQDLKIVCEEILKVLKPISIILFGGFGRGEGSALIKDNQVLVLKDYDILLVVKKRLSPSKVYEISENIHKRLGRANPLNSVSMELGSGADLLQFTLNDLLYFKDVKAYEIKVASKLLYGEDIRKRITLSPDELSPWSGVRFLFRKIVGMCEPFSPKYLKNPPVGKDKENKIYECGKMYLDMGTLLTLISKTYKPSYQERAEAIKKIFRPHFPKLSKEIPYLPERIDFFTSLKLLPSEDKYNAFDPVKLWFETRRDLGIVLKYYLKESGEDWVEIFERCNQKMKAEFINEMASHYLRKRFKIKNKILNQLLARGANFAYQKFFSLRYVLKLYRKEKALLLSALGEFPTFKVSTSGLMLLFSLNEDGTLNKDLFKSFIISLSKIYPIKIRGLTDTEKWEEAKNCFIKADRNFLDTFYETG